MSDFEHLRPDFTHYDGSITYEGEEVYVRGIGDRPLGVGIFAGCIVAREESGKEVQYPMVEVRGVLLSGGEVDLWSTDPELIEAHRYDVCYPAYLYKDEVRERCARLQNMMHRAVAESMGVQPD